MTTIRFFLSAPLLVIALAVAVYLQTSTTYRSRTSSTYLVSEPSSAAMHFGPTTLYGLDSEYSNAEWEHLIPPGGHTVVIEGKPYTVSLFHQMKCIDILRRSYLEPEENGISPIARHCLLYLREMILCQSDMRLERVHNTAGSAYRVYDSICNDWSEVFEAAQTIQSTSSILSKI